MYLLKDRHNDFNKKKPAFPLSTVFLVHFCFFPLLIVQFVFKPLLISSSFSINTGFQNTQDRIIIVL